MTTVHAGGGYGLGELLVVPEGEFTTGLVTASRGGVFTWETMLQGFVGTSPASFKLTIPAGALGEDFEVLVAPRPSWTNIRTGQPYASLGQVHLQVRNAAGVKVNPVFRKPIQIEHSLWGFPALETYDPMQAPPEADAWRYNDNAHAFEVHPSTAVVVDLQAGVVRYSLTQFSLWEIIQKESRNYVYSHGQWGVTVQSPSPDPPSITNTSVCGEEVQVPVYCGRYTASGEIDVDKESGITISAGLKTALQASYGASPSRSTSPASSAPR